MYILSNNIYDIEKIKKEIDVLIDEHGWHNNSQLSLQSPDGNFHTGNGKIEWNPGYKEEDFKQINTPIDWEITKFILQEELYRTRIMKLKPKECYSWHRDRTTRAHLVIETTENCFMLIDKDVMHIPANGKPYLLDTTKFHTAMNCTLDFDRIHLVGCKNVS